MCLLLFVIDHYFFYATGHETAFIYIRWESGFHGFYGDNNNPVIRLIMAIFILLNTFSSSFICVVFFVLLLSERSDSPNNKVGEILKFGLFNAIKVV